MTLGEQIFQLKVIGPDCQVKFQEDSVCIKSAYLISFGTSPSFGVSLTHFYIMEKTENLWLNY